MGKTLDGKYDNRPVRQIGVNMSNKNKVSKSSNTPKGKEDRDDPSSLPGWPGYRTRDGRSSLDPIDNRTEAGHTFGTVIQSLFTGQLKIRNPVYLFLSGVLGLVLITPLLLAIWDMLNGNLFSLSAWITLLITGIIGIAVLINFVKNLIRLVK
jgi:hypothetical protein